MARAHFSGLLLVALMAGCSLVPDRSDRYQFEQRGQPLLLPSWFEQGRVQDRYPVPRAQKAFVATGEFKVPPPPVPGAELLQEQFAIRSAGEDVWLAATEAPGRIWPALTGYWQAVGGVLEQQDSAAGRLVCRLDAKSLRARQLAASVGLDPDDSPAFEATVAQGIKRNSSEVRVRIERPPGGSPESSRKVLEELRDYLAQNQQVLESYSLAAQNLAGASRVELIGTGNDSHLSLDLAYERAWAAVGQALNDGKVPLVDLDRSAGEYLVNFVPGEEGREPGWFDWLTGGSGEGVLSDEYNFRVRLLDAQGSGVRVEVVPAAEDASAEDRATLLNRILEHLS